MLSASGCGRCFYLLIFFIQRQSLGSECIILLVFALGFDRVGGKSLGIWRVPVDGFMGFVFSNEQILHFSFACYEVFYTIDFFDIYNTAVPHSSERWGLYEAIMC